MDEYAEDFVLLTVTICVSHRDYPCNNITTEWEMPLVNPTLIEMLDNPEWTDISPSPSCQCSTPKILTMLPVCPEGAGGLPPPQVCLSSLDYRYDAANSFKCCKMMWFLLFRGFNPLVTCCWI